MGCLSCSYWFIGIFKIFFWHESLFWSRYALLVFSPTLGCIFILLMMSYIQSLWFDFCMWHEVVVKTHFIPRGYPFNPVRYIEKTFLSPLYCGFTIVIKRWPYYLIPILVKKKVLIPFKHLKILSRLKNPVKVKVILAETIVILILKILCLITLCLY